MTERIFTITEEEARKLAKDHSPRCQCAICPALRELDKR